MAAPKWAPKYRPAHIPARAHEVAVMVDIMEDPKLDTAKKMGAKLVSAAFALMAERTWYAIASMLDGTYPTFYGLFATEAAALKALDENSLGLFGKAFVVEVKGLSEREFDVARWEDEVRHPCTLCGHDEPAHHWPRSRVPGCVVGGCGCATYHRPAPAIPAVSAT